jgi:hypothetical protein
VKLITGMALVRKECGNLVSGTCLGLTCRGTLWREAGKCLIAEGDECEYYNQCLEPLIQRQRDEIEKARKKRCR